MSAVVGRASAQWKAEPQHALEEFVPGAWWYYASWEHEFDPQAFRRHEVQVVRRGREGVLFKHPWGSTFWVSKRFIETGTVILKAMPVGKRASSMVLPTAHWRQDRQQEHGGTMSTEADAGATSDEGASGAAMSEASTGDAGKDADVGWGRVGDCGEGGRPNIYPNPPIAFPAQVFRDEVSARLKLRAIGRVLRDYAGSECKQLVGDMLLGGSGFGEDRIEGRLRRIACLWNARTLLGEIHGELGEPAVTPDQLVDLAARTDKILELTDPGGWFGGRVEALMHAHRAAVVERGSR